MHNVTHMFTSTLKFTVATIPLTTHRMSYLPLCYGGFLYFVYIYPISELHDMCIPGSVMLYQEFIRDKSVQPCIPTVNDILQK